jgi:RHS repeat-associated protein
MAGISDKAIKGNYAENKYRFNNGTELQSKEFSDGSSLELYSTDFRGYDPQLGRFWQIDPYAEGTENISPYAFAIDNPIGYNDPLGLDTTWKVLPTVVKTYTPPPPLSRSDVTEGLADTKGDIGEISGRLDTGIPNSAGTQNGGSSTSGAAETLTLGTAAEEGGEIIITGTESLALVPALVVTTGVVAYGKWMQPEHPIAPPYSPVGDIAVGLPNVSLAKDKTDHLRGGKQKQRDASIKRYPKEFQRWYHREYKQPGDPDATPEELKELFEEWKLQHPEEPEPIDSLPGAIPH